MKRCFLAALLVAVLCGGVVAADVHKVIQNAKVYAVDGRYGGWPANHGIWVWGNEILVGFSAAYFQWLGPDRHPYNRSKPEEPYLARSLDGGVTWQIEPTPALVPPEGMYSDTTPAIKSTDLSEPIDFTNPGFCMTLRMSDASHGHSWFFYSYDRGKNWKGPFNFPMLGQQAIMARTDYIVNGKRDAMVFVTATKAAGGEGRPLVARTKDGGLSWKFMAWVGPDPGEGFSIMTSSVRLSKSGLLSTTRHEEVPDEGPNWIDAFYSSDDGKSWKHWSRPAPDTGAKSGNPPSLVRLRDGRLALTYGYRSDPFEIRARISSDNGRTWGDDIVLRSHAGAWDIGYTRTIQRADGKLVTVYYWAADAEKERTIEATIWDPGHVGN